jgi:hypothetical protein
MGRLAAAAVLFVHLAAAAEALYLFSAIPYFGDAGHTGEFVTHLYRLTDDHLKEVPIDLELPEFSHTVICDQESRRLLIGVPFSMAAGFKVMSMDKPGDFAPYWINEPDKSTAAVHFADAPESQQLLFVRLFPDSNHVSLGSGESLRMVDLRTHDWADVPAEAYAHLRITGGTRLHDYHSHFLGLEQLDGGQLVHPGAAQIPIGPPLPLSMRFSPIEGGKMLLSNPHFRAITSSSLGLSNTIFRLLDRRTNTWVQLQVPGNRSWDVRAFGSWMAGIVDRSVPREAFEVSPGRHKPEYTTGRRFRHVGEFYTIDDYLEEEDLYRPGVLFLYNIETRRYYQWDTHDGDCEILLVRDNIVYYRVDQSIFRARIGARTLGKAELLVQDAGVPGIHWAFFGPSGAEQ